MKRLIFIFLFIFLLGLSVEGAGLSLNVNIVDNLIEVGEEALFDVTVNNEQNVPDVFTFIISDLDWTWEKQFFDISSDSSKQFNLKLRAPSNIKSGIYSLNLKVYSTTNNDFYVYEPLFVTILDEKSFLKLEKFDYSVRGLDPRKQSNIVRAIIKNQYDKNIDNVDLYLESDIFDTVSRKVSFGEAELRIEEFLVELNSNAAEGMHNVRAIVKKNDEIILNQVKQVKVGEYSDIKEDMEESSGFLVKKTSIVRKNEGSVVSDETYRLRLTSFEKIFSFTNPEPSEIEKSGSDYYYIWNFNIKPGESYKISVEINYRDPIMILISFIIIVYLIIYLTESGISIRKRALTIKSKEGINYVKILLIIKNRGKKEIKNVRVVDQLFNVKSVPSDYGTLRPSKITRKDDNVLILWDNISLVGKEERIFSYRVNVEIRNKAVLPRAMVRYKSGNNFKVSKSNNVLVVA